MTSHLKNGFGWNTFSFLFGACSFGLFSGAFAASFWGGELVGSIRNQNQSPTFQRIFLVPVKGG